MHNWSMKELKMLRMRKASSHVSLLSKAIPFHAHYTPEGQTKAEEKHYRNTYTIFRTYFTLMMLRWLRDLDWKKRHTRE